MKIIKKDESREQCMEAGWYAYDYELDRPMKSEDILSLRELDADFVYLRSLKQPFYKVESKFFMLKGVEGKNTFRVSMYKEYEEEVCKRIEAIFTANS